MKVPNYNLIFICEKCFYRGAIPFFVLALTERQRKILLAGGLLNYTSHNAE